MIPGLGSSPGEGSGYSLQCFGLENPMVCIVHGVAKSWTRLSNFQLKKKNQQTSLFESGAEQGPHIVVNSLVYTLLPAFFLAMYLLKKQLTCPIEYPPCLDFADCRFNMSLYIQVQVHPPHTVLGQGAYPLHSCNSV